MSDYKRLFSYLYFYQHKIKEKNSGFVKVEIRNNQCRLQLSVKGGFLNQAPQWDVYGFMREGCKLRLWRLGRMNAGNGQGEWGAQMPLARLLGEAADLNHVAGLLAYGSRSKEDQGQLPDMEDGGKGLVCATVWDDLPLFRPGESSREMLHAAQVDMPEDPGQRMTEAEQRRKQEEKAGPEEELQSEEDLQSEKKIQLTKGELRSEEEEQLQAEGAGSAYDIGAEWDTLRELLEEKEVERMMADRAVLPEHCESAEREPEQRMPEPQEPEQRMPEPQEPEQRMPEQQEPERQEPERRMPEPQEPERRMPEQREPEQRIPEQREPEQQPGCPCPEQCIWSDMYQEPPKSLWEKLASFYPKLMINGMGSDWEILKIMPRDIGRLPRETWVYGNNSFLLHGYYRHHHLILACYKGTSPCQYYLGVPGTCSERERVMASMFGFTNYLPGGKRGYWYTPVNLGNN